MKAIAKFRIDCMNEQSKHLRETFLTFPFNSVDDADSKEWIAMKEEEEPLKELKLDLRRNTEEYDKTDMHRQIQIITHAEEANLRDR